MLASFQPPPLTSLSPLNKLGQPFLTLMGPSPFTSQAQHKKRNKRKGKIWRGGSGDVAKDIATLFSFRN